MTSKITARLVQSSSYDPWFNLSLEELLLDQLAENEVILYLWQNDHTIVIGRNQNAWKECRWEELAESGGKLARRLSGGGAVYHDLGNLNFTFIMNNRDFNIERQLAIILKAMEKLDLNASFSGRNDLVLDKRKFSGHAYYHRDNKVALHHGTILVHSDLEKLAFYLNPSQKKIASKGIDSVRSRVVNLTEINPALTIEQVRLNIQESFLSDWSSLDTENSSTPLITTYHNPFAKIPKDNRSLNKNLVQNLIQNHTPSNEDHEKLVQLYERNSSWEWRFGQSPSFDISFSERFTWGEVELGFNLKQGKINSCTIFSDAMDQELIRELANSLHGILFNKEDLLEVLQGLTANTSKDLILKDLKAWIKDLDI